MSGWLVITDEWGAIFLGFYLFTTLGFGFRMGLPFMRVCQAVSIAGFVGVFALAPYWQSHLVAWLAFLLPLFFVPAYARSLIVGLHQAKAKAEQASEAKSNMLAKVSHELRTPLNGIMASAELLEEYTAGPGAVALLATIQSASRDLLREINHLLDLRKLEAKGIELERRPFRPGDLVRQVHLTLRASALSKGLRFEAKISPQAESVLMGDPYYLQQVLMNLAGNAIKFTSTGHVTLCVEANPATTDSQRLAFSVADTGIGIPTHMLSRIFEPFVQAETSTSRRFGGTGLGTSIAKQLVALMGGTLQVESKENEGSRFWFEIELPVCTRPEEVNSPSTDSSTNPAEPNAVPHGKRILVADDNETNLQILKAMLDRDAHTVVLTPDGSTALVALNESEFDLALLDYNLGDQTGLDVMKAYRMGRLRTCPILFLTADATSETSRTLVDAGASGVLTKPISLDALRSGIREALASGRCTAPIRQPSYTETAPALALVKTNILDDSLLDRLRLLSSDPDFFPNLVRQSASEIAHYSKESQEAIRRRDFAKLRFSAHTLKGVAHNVGAVRLSSQAKRLMQAESANDGRDWPNEIAELAEETERVLNALSGLCAGEPVT